MFVSSSFLAGRLAAAGEALLRLASHHCVGAVCEGVRIELVAEALDPGGDGPKSEFHGGRTEVLTGTPGLQLGEPQAGSSES